MSKNLHCDVGDHDFSEMEEGRAKLAVTFYNRYDDGSPNTIAEQADACAEHADLFRPTRRNIAPRGRRTLRELTTQFPNHPKRPDNYAEALAYVEALSEGETTEGKALVNAEGYAEHSPNVVETPVGKKLVDAEEYAEYIKYMEAQNGIVSP
jgi:hypothetical protein